MSRKTTKIAVIAGVAVVGVTTGIVGLTLLKSSSAQTISPLSSLEQARQLSKGKKDACLADTQQAVDAVKKDDGTLEFNGNKISKFEMAASSAIMDVPAGTEYKMTINSYDNGIVKGAMAYEYGYGIYNYIIKKLPNAGEWELVSTVACERS